MGKTFKQNLKHKIFNVEHARQDIWYAFSFNPLIGTFDSQNIMDMYRQICHTLHKAPPYCKWEIYFELSPVGKIHVHGRIIINDIGKFYAYTVPYLCRRGAMEIDTIDEKDKGVYWKTYCSKQEGIMKILLEPLLLQVRLKSADKEWLEKYCHDYEKYKQTDFQQNAYIDSDDEQEPIPDQPGDLDN